MNTTYDEPSEFSSPKTNMAPTTTFAKSKKGVVVLVALCMMFFYTGRLSSSSGGGAPLDASLLRGFQQDVVRGETTKPLMSRRYWYRRGNLMDLCKPWYDPCVKDKVCHELQLKVAKECDCDSDLSCIDNAMIDFGIRYNIHYYNFFSCVVNNWDNPSSTPSDKMYAF